MLMPLSDADFTSILEDKSKKIVGDIEWLEDEDHSPALEFRAEVKSEKGWPLFIKGSYNSLAMALTLQRHLISSPKFLNNFFSMRHIRSGISFPYPINPCEKYM